ncbi:hypothetical protein EOM71_02910, partial [Candidatus Falkowbacteria bacterium]|nr:hypothetical protein [Candidatus Falkowbacteria bacterium]
MIHLPKINNLVIFTGAYLIIIGSLFFAAASAYQYCIQRPDFVKWSSPDETANYYFSKFYAERRQFTIDNQLNLPEAEIVRPRSFKAP